MEPFTLLKTGFFGIHKVYKFFAAIDEDERKAQLFDHFKRYIGDSSIQSLPLDDDDLEKMHICYVPVLNLSFVMSSYENIILTRVLFYLLLEPHDRLQIYKNSYEQQSDIRDCKSILETQEKRVRYLLEQWQHYNMEPPTRLKRLDLDFQCYGRIIHPSFDYVGFNDELSGELAHKRFDLVCRLHNQPGCDCFNHYRD